LWYLFGVIAFALLLYIGYLLVSAEWQEQFLKKANKTLIYGLVGLLIVILSYSIVKLIANLW
jgi:TM2 domain-containing membrane protein YozV